MIIISVSGLHGTGKSTIAKKIAESLKIGYYSTGQAFRDLAKEMNMTLEEFTKYVENHPEIDNKLDDKIVDVAKKGNVVVESQLSGHILESIADFKILLSCPLETRVKRMSERDGTSYEKKLKETKMREKSEQQRFKFMYNIDLSVNEKAKDIYDYILDTKNLTINEVVENILIALRNFKK